MIATEKPAASSLFSAQFGSCVLQSPRGLIRCAVIAWDFWGFSSCINCHLLLILPQLLRCHSVISWASVMNLQELFSQNSSDVFKIFIPIATAALAVVIANREQHRRVLGAILKKQIHYALERPLIGFFLEVTVCVISQKNCESKTSRWSAQFLTSYAAQQDILWRLLHHAQGSLFDLATDKHIMWPGKKNVSTLQ